MWHPACTSLHIIYRGYSERVNAEINGPNLEPVKDSRP